MHRGRPPIPIDVATDAKYPSVRIPRGMRMEIPADYPKPPTELTGSALVEWNRIHGILHDAGVITQLDRGILAAYCLAYAQMIDLSVSSDDPETALDRASLSQRAMTHVRQLGAQLGLTPKSRTQIVKSPAPSTEESIEEFIADAGRSEVDTKPE